MDGTSTYTNTWCFVPGAPDYIVSDDGKVQGPRGKVLRPLESKSGHLYVFIHRRKRWVHSLVLEAFRGKCPDGCECRHLDGNPKNNHLANLAWGTHLENVNDRWRHGTMPVPHESIWTKLTPGDIPVIRLFHERGHSTRDIGKVFGVSHTTVQKIIRGERWKGY